MTLLEALLIVAVVALTLQLLLIQRHYDKKLADQAFVINFLVDRTMINLDNPEHLNDIRDKLFNSSQ